MDRGETRCAAAELGPSMAACGGGSGGRQPPWSSPRGTIPYPPLEAIYLCWAGKVSGRWPIPVFLPLDAYEALSARP